MWCLESPRGEVYNIIPGRVHTVSRKNGDIVLADDQSVSRKHAYLEVQSPITEGVSVWDESSKYGTFVNDGIAGDKRLPASFKAAITEGAKVRFGLQDKNIWTLKKAKLCACAHSLSPIEKSRVKAVLNQIGFDLVDSWNEEITHLTTNYIRLSYEVLCALASAKPIVLPEFWQAYARMMKGEGSVPQPASFIPPLEDNKHLKNRLSCLPNEGRKTLFVDKNFVFSSSQSYKTFKTVIETAGGKAFKMSTCGWSLQDYLKPNVVVLSCDEKEQTSFYNKLLSTLLDKNLRFIPVEDIGLALWKVSTSLHCNPAKSVNSILRRPDDIQDTGATLVINTEDEAVATGVDIDDQLVIPPTLTESHLSTEDATMSMSVRATEKTSPVRPTRKRTRENSVERQNIKSTKTSPKVVSVKKEPEEEEEDMFACEDDYARPSTSNNSSSTLFNSTSNNNSSKRFKAGFDSSLVKEDNKPAEKDDNGFFFPSPLKKKKTKPPVEDEDEVDLFELPKEPASSKSNTIENDEDDFDFLSSSKLSRSMGASKRNRLEESNDMFETEDLPSPACSARGEKRKGRCHSESESPPLKKITKACLDVTNVHNSHKPSTSIAGFLNKNSSSIIKKEIKNEPDDTTDLANRFCAKVVITSLLRKPKVNDCSNTSVNTSGQSGKNFKKFKKVWSGSTTKQHITTSRVRTFNGHSLNSTGREEEQEDDPFLPSRPAPAANAAAAAAAAPTARHNGHQNNIHDDDDYDDEFALPTYSQCM